MQAEDTGIILYTNNLEQTPEQEQLDELYGVMEVRNQSLEVNWTNKLVHYHEHYFYSASGTLYKKDTVLKGEFQVEGSKFIANVAGQYLHYVRGNNNVQTDENKPQVEGKLTFEKTENGIKITEVKLSENGANFNTYFAAEINMKRK